ncbi:MAG: glycosyltransferase family 9 protein [Candidatus Scalindua sp.]
MIMKMAEKKMVSPVFPVLNSNKTAIRACELAKQNNCSNKILLGITQGIGNVIMATPLIKALRTLNLEIDILEGGFKPNATDVLKNMQGVRLITEEEAGKTIYLLGLQTIWPRPGIEQFCAQTRSAGNIINAWQKGIFAHEVEMNMSLAYTLQYKGDIPSLYCHYNKAVDTTTFDLGLPVKVINTSKYIRVGIHVCRSYHHQFYANRALNKPLEIAIELEKAGYSPVIVGHKDCVTKKEKENYPISTSFFDGMDLADTAGIIKELDCMINEDSGIMHVCAAMDIPQLAIFGPTSDMKNRPWSEKAAVIKQGNLPCLPCQFTPKESTCTRNVCMDISPEYIVNQVKMLIERFPKNDKGKNT